MDKSSSNLQHNSQRMFLSRLRVPGMPRALHRRPEHAQCNLHVRNDILLADDVENLGMSNQFERLLAGAADHQRTIGGLHALGEGFQCVEAGPVQSGHVAKAKNDHRPEALQVFAGFFQFACGAKKKGSMNAENCHVAWDRLVLENCGVIFDVLVRLDGGRFRPVREKNREHHADLTATVGSANTVSKVAAQTARSAHEE